MNKSRTKKFKNPVAGIISVPQLDVLFNHFVDVGSEVTGEGELLEVGHSSRVVDIHCVISGNSEGISNRTVSPRVYVANQNPHTNATKAIPWDISPPTK